MKLRNVRIGLSSVNRVASQKNCEVVEVKTSYKRLDNGSFSKDDVDYFSLVLAGNKYDTFTVKIMPATNSIASKITQVADALAKEQEVIIEFKNLKLSLYAMLNNGTLYSGVSGKADDFTIVSTTDPEEDVDIVL